MNVAVESQSRPSTPALHATTSEPPTQRGHRCPGLIDANRWDAADQLRGEIHGAERLIEHATELAVAHGPPTLRVNVGPLLARFAAAKIQIRTAYEALGRRTRDVRQPSPAEEWLLDNAHIVDDQLREIEEDLPRGYLVKLPRLATGVMRGYPRVYGVCLDYLRHTDARIDVASLIPFVEAYQRSHPFTIGEVWAVPIMIRMGLVLGIGALATTEATALEKTDSDAWGAELIAHAQSPVQLAATLARFDSDGAPIDAPRLERLIRYLRQHDAPHDVAFQWITAHAARIDTTPEELVRHQHLLQSADRVSVGNAITSMRAIGTLDWNEFFERTSLVEAVLMADPTGDYLGMDDASRDRYRHAIEALGRRSPQSEVAIARVALEQASRAAGRSEQGGEQGHIGHWLIGDGRAELEARVEYRPRLAEHLRRPILAHSAAFYLGAIAVCTGLAAKVALASSVARVPLALALFMLIPACEIAVACVNGLVVALFPPRMLAKLAFESGVPAEHRTLVAVPALLESRETLAKLLEDLEVRALATPDENLHFALVTDWVDAPVATRPEDDLLLDEAVDGIAALNEHHGAHRFSLLHRRRLRDDSEECWMGWERKRGKLEELCRLLRGATDTSFSIVTAPTQLLMTMRYVITLDADTELPRDVARRLVGAIAHPLNRPQIDLKSQRVVKGHGVIQPRVGTLPVSARRSRYAKILTGPAGLDPYTSAVSDVYQDLFAEGSFVGKGIFDVDAFHAVLVGRVPDNALLSHDLFEGIFARAALATDIEVLDEQPASYAVASGRQHRWTRGDWQLLPWLFGSGSGLRAIDRWKIFDNLRRSVLGISLVTLCVGSWLSGARLAAWATGVLLAVHALPVVARFCLNLSRRATSSTFTGSVGGELATNARQALVALVFLLDGALIATDAIARTLYRLAISRKLLLEWKTTNQAERQARTGASRFDRRRWFSSALAIGVAVLVVAFARTSTPFALPVLLLWATAPAIATWLAQPLSTRTPGRHLSHADRAFLRLGARKTWRFFESFVTAEDQFLPPDNFQEEPRGVVAHRTSPTNIGLYLLSIVAARDFGFITLRDLVERLTATLGSIEKLGRHEGHLLNWYDTMSLRPLEPQYVSTVDSGNLAAYLWTLGEACTELSARDVVGPNLLVSAHDAIVLARHPIATTAARASPFGVTIAALDDALAMAIVEAAGGAESIDAALGALSAKAATARDACLAANTDAETTHWIRASATLLEDALQELQRQTPHLVRLSVAPSIFRSAALAKPWADVRRILGRARSPHAIATVGQEAATALDALSSALATASSSAPDRAAGSAYLSELRADLDRASEAATALTTALSSLGARAVAIADAMNFRFLYDEQRGLFSIGYDVGSGRLDASYYDLLASEARLGSLVAIAKGDAPQKHWFRLARPLTGGAGERGLLSWSGSMFEFLMPLLITKNCPETLLSETYRAVVIRQRAYGAAQTVPWGISESAYNIMDLGMTYQYRAFGVPGLGLKAGLSDDLVIAPYASALASLVRPDLAIDNLRVLSKAGAEGRFGFYESVDFTPRRLPPGRASVVVKTFMAHHLGMTLLAFGEVLHETPMARRFHRDPRVKATELLLEERIPTRVAVVELPAPQRATARPGKSDFDEQEHIDLETLPLPRVQMLGQGELSTMVTALGEGFTAWKGSDVTRFREDHALGVGGTFLYIRDLTSGRTWSAGHQPVRATPDAYEARFAIDRVELRRRDGDLESFTEIAVSPEFPLEVRRLTLTNHGTEAHEVDVTSYTEVVLAPRAADLAHRAFSSMFVQTEALLDRDALLARRRPKSPTEGEKWIVQALDSASDGWTSFEHDTSRATFLGRHRTTSAPVALERGARLAATTGTVLDPALSMRRTVRIPAGGRATIQLLTGVASSRAQAIDLLERSRAPNAIPRTFELAWSDARVELRHLGLSAKKSHTFQRLLSCVLFPQTRLRERTLSAVGRGRGMGALWMHGISGDLPLVVVRVDAADFSELLTDVLLAQELWRSHCVEVDLVVINEEPPGYLQPLRDMVVDVLRASPSQGRLDQRGGVFVRHQHQLGADDYATLLHAARVVLASSRGSLARQIRGAATLRSPRATAIQRRTPRYFSKTIDAPHETLIFDSGVGGFSADGREYVIRVGPGAKTPAPWCNVIANASFGALVSESGAGVTWFGNSQRHRLTPWSNDATSDPSGESLYLRDDEDGSSWSPTPLPAGGSASFEVRHGQGYTDFRHARQELAHALTIFVSATEPVKLYRLRITNHGARVRRLSLFGLFEWVLGGTRESTRTSVVTQWDAEVGALLAGNALGLFPQRVAFVGASHSIADFTGDRDELFGDAGDRRRPVALDFPTLSGTVGAALDPCGAIRVPIAVDPGETVEVTIVFGEGDGVEHARSLLRAHTTQASVASTYRDAVGRWESLLSAVTIKTPDPALDLLMNRWLLYQVTSCRLWGRTAFYQSGGAYGFRDQLQDVLALLHARPELAREHILRSAARQFVEGDVQHWWHPESGEGVRTRCSDDLLWLPYATAEYVRVTGDVGILNEQISLLTSRALTDTEDDLFATPAASSEVISLYDHCARALDRGTTSGPRGLPLMGSGDWNDGMTRVGRGGVGESVWLAWFLAKTAQIFVAIATLRGDEARAIACRNLCARLARAVDEHAWDGAWYRRAYFDDGAALGTSASGECRIDAIAQSWAVLAGIGDPSRARQGVDASLAMLLQPENEGLFALFTPPFDGGGRDPGYLGAYPPGLRENGGQYTHAAWWTVEALAGLGAGDRAGKLLAMLNPIHHTATADQVDRYRTEPYVLTADVYTAPGQQGRGGWSWYTGSASVMARVVLDSILGLRKTGTTLRFEPCIPKGWQRYEITYRQRDAVLHISVENPTGVEGGVAHVELDGVAQTGLAIELDGLHGAHEVRVLLGP